MPYGQPDDVSGAFLLVVAFRSQMHVLGMDSSPKMSTSGYSLAGKVMSPKMGMS